MFKEIYINFSVKVLAFSINSIFPLLVIPYVISIIGVDSFGAVEYGLSVLAFFQVIGMLGVPIVGMRAISKEMDGIKQASIVFNIMKYVWVINSIVVFTYFIFLKYFSQSWDLSFEISLSLIFILLANFFNVDWYFEGRKKFKFIAVKSVIVRGLQIYLIYLFINNDGDTDLYALLFSLGVFGGYFIGFLVFIIQNIKKLNKITKTTIYLVPLLLVFILQNSNLLYTQIDKIFIAQSSFGEIGVATYAVPQKISIYINAVVYALSFVAIPEFAKLLLNDINNYWVNIKKMSTILILTGLFLGVIVILFNSEILNYFSVEGIINANIVLFIFMIRIPFIALEGFLNTQVFLLNDKERILVKYYFVFGALNVLVNFLLFKELSPVTALLSTFIIEILLLFSLITFVNKKIYIGFKKISSSSFRIIILGIIIESCLFLIEPHLNIFYKILIFILVLISLIYYNFKRLNVNGA